MSPSARKEAWKLDQLAKSEFFHQKLHEYKMLEIAYELEEIQGDKLDWDITLLGISDRAWNKIIHRGIKPVRIFAHPYVLEHVQGALGYYRMLAMVSQKSMKRVGLNGDRFEQGKSFMSEPESTTFSQHLNTIVSILLEADEDNLDPREFDIWRGMAAGTQAQGSWQNVKGDKAEILIKSLVRNRLFNQELVSSENNQESRFVLNDQRTVVFSDEPDIAIYDENNKILIAIEIKGGIDTAGVLERIGAALKSLSRAKEESSSSLTILVLQSVSLSEQAHQDLEANQNIINQWFAIEDIRDDDDQRERFFSLLKV